MNVGWLIDAEMFESYRDDLVANIRAQGHEVRLIRAPRPPYRWDDVDCGYRQTFPKDACVIAHGDIELATRIHRERRWTPGAFCTVEHFFCSNYYCRFGQFLLNRDYIMLPFGDLRRCRDFLFRSVGQDGRIFVRPDSPLKLFAGQVVRLETFDADVEFMSLYEFPPESLVVVGSPHTIESEWRFVAVDKKVIAGSQYKHAGKMDPRPEYPPGAFELASQIASSDYEPDPAWVIDVCQTADGSFHLLEIGGFSFCDLYACDKSAIVGGLAGRDLAMATTPQRESRPLIVPASRNFSRVGARIRIWLALYAIRIVRRLRLLRLCRPGRLRLRRGRPGRLLLRRRRLLSASRLRPTSRRDRLRLSRRPHLSHIFPSVRLEVRIESLLDLIQIWIKSLMNLGRKHRMRLVEQRDDVMA